MTFIKITHNVQIGDRKIWPEIVNLDAISRAVRQEKGERGPGEEPLAWTTLRVWFVYSEVPLIYQGEVAEQLWRLLENESIELEKF